jgi:hypothetical protein
MSELNNAFMRELLVRSHNSVGIHDKVFGQFPNCRELVPDVKRPRLDCMLHLIDELKVKRSSRRMVETKYHSVLVF